MIYVKDYKGDTVGIALSMLSYPEGVLKFLIVVDEYGVYTLEPFSGIYKKLTKLYFGGNEYKIVGYDFKGKYYEVKE